MEQNTAINLEQGMEFKQGRQRKWRQVQRVIKKSPHPTLQGKVLIILNNCRQVVLEENHPIIVNSKNNNIKEITKYLGELVEHIPDGLWDLWDVVNLVNLQLNIYVRYGKKGVDFQKAVDFATSIPKFTDFDSDEFTTWLLKDREYLKYYK